MDPGTMRNTYNPVPDCYHAEQAIDAIDDAIVFLDSAMQRIQLAARHSGGADKLADEYLDRLIECRDGFAHQRNALDEEMSYALGVG
jgi:hypothetical protein